MTILPAEGFSKGGRSGVRPVAPGRELSDWINKSARAGLPEMHASPVAAAPELAENDRRRSRRLAVPANEVIGRPVVTRNPNTDSSERLGVQRERRLISPRKPDVIQVPTLRERGPERRPKQAAPAADSQPATDSGDGRTSPKIRHQLPAPAEKAEGDGSARERRLSREGDSASQTPAPEGGANAAKEERRRARQEQSAIPRPKESNPSADSPRDNDSRSRERRPPTGDPKPREDAQSRTKAEEPARSHDRGGSTQRVEPRAERPSSDNQAHQERRQEKEQRQEPQKPQEQRRKP